MSEEALTLQMEILEALKHGTFRLLDGLPFGTGEELEMQYDITFRELTAGDIIDAQLASERVVETRQGPQLVSSPAQMGLEMLRRQIAKVGVINGPLSLLLLKKLSQRDFHRVSLATDLRDVAQAAAMLPDRGRVVAVSE
ncbi:TPA: phage tail assembly protein [Klebsiella variicola]|nr:phage tail assembly protein [Klebsiella variicola]